MNPRVPMGHLRTEIMSNSCDPQAWEHGGDEETADVARRKGAAPRRDGLRRGVRRDFGRWGQPAAPRPASPMVEFLKIMAKYGFRLQRGTGDQGGKTQYTHTVSISSYHKSICIGNGMAVASTHKSTPTSNNTPALTTTRHPDLDHVKPRPQRGGGLPHTSYPPTAPT